MPEEPKKPEGQQPNGTQTPPVQDPPAQKPAEGAGQTPPANTPAAKPAPTQEEIDRKIDAFLRGNATKQPPQGTPGTASQVTRTSPPTGTTGTKKSAKELLEEGDTLGAMQRVAEDTRETTMREMATTAQVTDFNAKRYDANKAVYKAHPELLETDEGKKSVGEVPIAAAMAQVYNEFPWLLNAPEGPLAAMQMAEKRLDADKASKATREAQNAGAQGEAARQDATRASAALSSSGTGAPPPPSGKVQLSDAEKIVAARMGLDEATYAQFKGRKPVHDDAYYNKYKHSHLKPEAGR